MRRRTLVITDNVRLSSFFSDFIAGQDLCEVVGLACSAQAPAELLRNKIFEVIDVRRDSARLCRDYELVVSAHCKQFFPKSLHEQVECINIHPGYNPETRGWFPQVWAITRGVNAGVTVHRIDGELDHGDIIDRFVVPVRIWDTSRTAYDRILGAEIDWIRHNFHRLIEGDYSVSKPEGDGDLYTKADFSSLCRIELEQVGSFRNFYDRLRALSFDGYRNAYFIDPESGARIFLELRVVPEADDANATDSHD